MVGYTFSPSVVESEGKPGKYDVGCRVTYNNGDGVEQFIEHRVWLTGIANYDTACDFAHQTVKFMLAYYERMISHLVERMIQDEPISSLSPDGIRSELDTQCGEHRTDQSIGLESDSEKG